MSFEGSRSVIIKDLSGNVVTAQSGNLNIAGSISANAAISGQTIAIWGASGRNSTYITNQSGNLALSVVPGNGIGDGLSLGTTNMTAAAVELLGFDGVASTWNRVRVTASGTIASQAGIQYRLLTDTTQAGSTVRINTPLPAISNSGGNSLGSGVVVHGIRIKHLLSGEGNLLSGFVWVGGSGTNNAPFSGNGYPLFMGESLELKNVSNFNQVRIVAALSGLLVSAIGVDF